MRKVWMLVTVSCLLWGRAAADDVYVDLSQKLYDMKISLLNQMSQV